MIYSLCLWYLVLIDPACQKRILLLLLLSLRLVQKKVKTLERSHCELTDLSRPGVTSVLSSGTLVQWNVLQIIQLIS